jgi:hypothetical protein
MRNPATHRSPQIATPLRAAIPSNRLTEHRRAVEPAGSALRSRATREVRFARFPIADVDIPTPEPVAPPLKPWRRFRNE